MITSDVKHPNAFLQHVLQECGSPYATIVIGGAARALVTGEPVKDYDVLFASPSGRATFREALKNKLFAKHVASTFTMTNRDKTCEDFAVRNIASPSGYDVFQLRVEFRNSPEEIFAITDMTAVQFAYSWGNGNATLHTTEQAMEDVEAKRIRLYNVSSPISTLARVRRLVEKGWSEPTDMDKLIAAAATAGDIGKKLKRAKGGTL